MKLRDPLKLDRLTIYGLCCKPTRQIYVGATVNPLRQHFSLIRAQSRQLVRRGGRPNKLQQALDFHPKSAFFMKALLRPQDEQEADLWRDQLCAWWGTLAGGLNSKLMFYQDLEQATRAICDEVRSLSREEFINEALTVDVWHG